MNQFQNLKLATNQQPRKQRVNNMGESLRPLRDNVILTNLERGERLSSSGIVILNDDGKDSGIRARWGQVYAVGPEQKDVNVGDWVLMQHGRWTVGADLKLKGSDAVRFWQADTKGILGISTNGRPPNISVETIVDVAEDYSKMNVKSTKKI
jgi:co-chaperonin GroES (HSP10)